MSWRPDTDHRYRPRECDLLMDPYYGPGVCHLCDHYSHADRDDSL
jgi:hypothetical protein